MSLIETALYERLTSYGDLAALVGTRVYPGGVLPQGATIPAIVMTAVSEPRYHSHSGPAGIYYPRFQFTVSATSALAAKEIALEVDRALDGASGQWAGIEVRACHVDNITDLPFSDVTEIYQIAIDAIIYYER